MFIVRFIYTRRSGSHEVTVIQTDKAIHFIENVAGMYLAARVDGMKTLAGLFGRAHSALKLFRT